MTFSRCLTEDYKKQSKNHKIRLNLLYVKFLRYSFVHIKDLTDELVVCKCLKLCSIAYLEVASVCTCKKKNFRDAALFFSNKTNF